MSKEIELNDIFGVEKKIELRKFIDKHKFMNNQISDRITLQTYRELEEYGVYIHYELDHYNDGTNLNFSIVSGSCAITESGTCPFSLLISTIYVFLILNFHSFAFLLKLP